MCCVEVILPMWYVALDTFSLKGRRLCDCFRGGVPCVCTRGKVVVVAALVSFGFDLE